MPSPTRDRYAIAIQGFFERTVQKEALYKGAGRDIVYRPIHNTAEVLVDHLVQEPVRSEHDIVGNAHNYLMRPDNFADDRRLAPNRGKECPPQRTDVLQTHDGLRSANQRSFRK